MKIIKTIVCCFLASALLPQCARSQFETLKRLERQIQKAPNAADYITSQLKNTKIVFIGEGHSSINEEVFFVENADKFYEAGMRYLFLESPIPEFVIPGSKDYFFVMFYPWTSAGWRYENVLFYKKVIEMSKKEHSPLIVIAPEDGRKQADSSNPNYNLGEFTNYRDSYASKVIIDTLNKAEPNAKAVIFYGADHAANRIVKSSETDGFFTADRFPMKYLLAKQFGTNINSYEFFFNKTYFDERGFDKSILAPVDSPRVLNPKGVKLLSSIEDSEWFGSYDYLIIESAIQCGMFYQYAPTDENLRFLLKLVKEYETEKQYEKIDTQFSTTDPQAQYLMAIYYLKLYFGAHFDYDFWYTGGAQHNALAPAVEKLDDYAFAKGQDSSQMILLRHTPEAIREWSGLLSYAGLEGFLKDAVKRKQTIDYCKKALEIFPEEIWSLYWLGFVNTEEGDYGVGLAAFQQLFKNPLSRCMESLPLAYSKAAVCAERTGTAALAEEYRRISASLINEHNIDVSGYYYTGHLFEK